MNKVVLEGEYRSIGSLEFDAGPFTVLFGTNNAGKTNILEAIYGILAPTDMPGQFDEGTPAPGVRGSDDLLPPCGAVQVRLEPGIDFDDAIGAAAPLDLYAARPGSPPDTAWFFSNWMADYTDDHRIGLLFPDDSENARELLQDLIFPSWLPDSEGPDQSLCGVGGPRPRPLFLGWEFGNVDDWVTTEILGRFKDPGIDGRNLIDKVGAPPHESWLQLVDGTSWQVNPIVVTFVNTLADLASKLLPDFLDGEIGAEFQIGTEWGAAPVIRVGYRGRGTEIWRSLNDLGRGAARWTAIAVQVALHLMTKDIPMRQKLKSWTPDAATLLGVQEYAQFSNLAGNILFVDEPEAHLHPSAVGSVVRWCQRMVDLGCNVVAASHHEEFLRTPEGVTFVKVTRESDPPRRTQVRTLRSAVTPLLQDLATEVGMHPAIAFSLHKAILFVEGPLDVAVLEEYAEPRFDAAGVTIIPIHGTKGYEGLIDGEFAARLGIKAGVLFDQTQAATMWDRTNNKRSSEEVKLVRLVKRFEELGLPPPTPFGVPEDDLLFSLPANAVREFLHGPFPGWHELVEECRMAEGRGPSDSVGWKSYAKSQYSLPINTADGVRRIVRALDLAGVELPSIRTVVDEVIAWAAD